MSLRLALIFDRPSAAAWQIDAVREIATLGDVELVAFICSFRRGLRRRLWELLLRSVFRARSERRREVTELGLGNLRRIRPAKLAGVLAAAGIGIVITFEVDDLPEDVVAATPHGVWAFGYGDDTSLTPRRGKAAPAFREVLGRRPIAKAGLYACTTGGTRRLEGATTSVDVVSLGTTLATLRWASAFFVRQGIVHFRDGVDRGDDVSAPPPSVGRAPGPGEIAVLICVLAGRQLVSLFRRIFRPMQWNVGIVRRPIHTFLEDAGPPVVEWFPTPARRRFLADPFGHHAADRLIVYVEDFDYRRAKAEICAIEIAGDGSPGESVPVYARDVHLSYPYTFTHEGTTYMVPESEEGGDVRLLEMEAAHSFKEVATLLTGVRVVDATPFQHDGRWWLAATEMDPVRGALSVSMWFADTLFDQWSSHPANPVKIDVRSSRPAGTPFYHDGALFRPAQDCSEKYGGRVVINRVRRLTPTEFEEEVVATVDPNPADHFGGGLHTLSAAGDVTLVDGRRDVFIPANVTGIARKALSWLLAGGADDADEPR